MSVLRLNVLDFGAVGDGRTKDTRAIQAAVDKASERGGRVVVPPGRYLIGSVRLLSNVVLDLMPGAVLVGSTDLEDYDATRWGHHKDITPWHLIVAEDAENLAIVGEGAIEGQGPAFWQSERPHEWSFWREKTRRPSPMVHLERCQHVRVENVTLRDSAGWTLHLQDCDHARVTGVTIRNTPFGPNSDGIDITGCHYVTITGCDIDTGDDAIALKTTEYSRDCRFITISDCILKTSCVAVRIGFESYRPHRFITVTNCVVPSALRVLDLRTLEGGDIEHVIVSNITGTTNVGWPYTRPIEMSCHRVDNVYKAVMPEEHPDYGKDKPTPRAGVIRDIILRDIDLLTDGRVTLVADEDARLENVTIDGLRLRYALLEDISALKDAGSNSFMPGDHADARAAAAAVVLKNVRNVRLKGLEIHWPEYPVSDDWLVLQTPNRYINKAFYEGNEEAVRAGELRPAYYALWARGVVGGVAEVEGLTASDGTGPALDVVDSSLLWR